MWGFSVTNFSFSSVPSDNVDLLILARFSPVTGRSVSLVLL